MSRDNSTSRGRVEINELRLRAPGLTREQARALGEMVAEGLAEMNLEGSRTGRRVPRLNLNIRAPLNGSIRRIADEISGSVRRQL